MNRPLGYENPNDDRWATIRSNRLEIECWDANHLSSVSTRSFPFVKNVVWHSVPVTGSFKFHRESSARRGLSRDERKRTSFAVVVQLNPNRGIVNSVLVLEHWSICSTKFSFRRIKRAVSKCIILLRENAKLESKDCFSFEQVHIRLCCPVTKQPLNSLNTY